MALAKASRKAIAEDIAVYGMRAVQSVHVIVFRSDEFIFALGAQPPLSPGGPKLLIC